MLDCSGINMLARSSELKAYPAAGGYASTERGDGDAGSGPDQKGTDKVLRLDGDMRHHPNRCVASTATSRPSRIALPAPSPSSIIARWPSSSNIHTRLVPEWGKAGVDDETSGGRRSRHAAERRTAYHCRTPPASPEIEHEVYLSTTASTRRGGLEE